MFCIILYWENQGGDKFFQSFNGHVFILLCLLQIELIQIVISSKQYMMSYTGFIFATQILNAPDLFQNKFQFIRIKSLFIRTKYPSVWFQF